MPAMLDVNSDEHEAHFLFHDGDVIYVVPESGYDVFREQKTGNGRRNTAAIVIDNDDVVKNRYM